MSAPRHATTILHRGEHFLLNVEHILVALHLSSPTSRIAAPRSLKTPNFPSGLLELPWSYILQNLSDPSGTSVESATKSLPKEPILDLERLLATLKAPLLGSVVMASKAGQSSSSSSSSKGGAAAAPPSKPKPLPPRVGEIEVRRSVNRCTSAQTKGLTLPSTLIAGW